ncbi:ribosome biogenesis GTPase Der [Candidatus Marinamargulisbacteria bacterium SCGC AAA071-K20]|nr:ribosome biogenesis GTPase Der [Candidatus Marinamargulisbacteria bacterium SCGC AAA071-K20]
MSISKLEEVVIVGRPNVGKSTLINRILKKKKTITLNEPGVTRDLVSFPVTVNGHTFMLIDSGGVSMQKKETDLIQVEVVEKVKMAIKNATKVIMVVDGHNGLQTEDRDMAKFLRPYQDKVILAVNKMDNKQRHDQLSEFLKLGFKELFPISSVQGHGVEVMLKTLTDGLAKGSRKELEAVYNISFLGCPNVGKSSLLNAIVEEDKVIVSDVEGTTRDSVSVYFRHNKQTFCLIDTAGIRKKFRNAEAIEFYSVVRTNKTIEESDLVIVVIDANKGMSHQDKRNVQAVIDAKKNMILFINKWDLMEDSDVKEKGFTKLLVSDMPVLQYYPMLYGSAKKAKGLSDIFKIVPEIIERANTRISTSHLNQFVEQVIKRNPPTAKYGKDVKVFYATQAESSPPTFVIFVNHRENITNTYVRFVEKRIRQYFGYSGCPVVVQFRKHR